jgi:uncharacterized damage-inducible protein DinB
MSDELTRMRRLLTHDGWANAAALAALRTGPAPQKARQWMAHIIGAERTWLARIRQERAAMAVWPDLDLDACAAELTELMAAWLRLLHGLDEEGLDAGVSYRNSKGESWTSTVGDILTHVALHASYHRGQIAASIREAGGPPPYTDYIQAARLGLLQ